MVATKPANMRQESTRKIAQKPIKNNEDVDKVSYESMEHKNQVLEAPPEDMRLQNNESFASLNPVATRIDQKAAGPK